MFYIADYVVDFQAELWTTYSSFWHQDWKKVITLQTTGSSELVHLLVPGIQQSHAHHPARNKAFWLKT